MIIVRLLGGLGNQMFQYACGRAAALRAGTDLLLDARDVPDSTPAAPRQYGLYVFRVAAEPASAQTLARLTLPPRGSWERLKCRLSGRPTDRPRVHRVAEPHFHFDPTVLEVRDDIALDGFWQSEKYFLDQAETIRRDFTLRPEYAAGAEAPPGWDADQVTPVSLHVRRGDFVSDGRTSAYHGVCSLDYYRACADYVHERVPNAVFLLFTDDAPWVRDNLRLPYRMLQVSDGTLRDYQELLLMSRCRHHVIANSSFSWWGAWLDPRPDKIVCAPRRWFAREDSDTTDLLPGSWVRF